LIFRKYRSDISYIIKKNKICLISQWQNDKLIKYEIDLTQSYKEEKSILQTVKEPVALCNNLTERLSFGER